MTDGSVTMPALGRVQPGEGLRPLDASSDGGKIPFDTLGGNRHQDVSGSRRGPCSRRDVGSQSFATTAQG